MSRTVGRRKSNFKIISVNKQLASGPKLKFRWSTSAAHLAAIEDPSSIILPSIPPDQPKQRTFTVSSLSTDPNSISQSSISTQKSSNLSRVAKQCQSPVSVRSNKSSVQSCPLSLTYAQLHQSRPTSPIRRQKQARLSIVSVSSERRDSIASLNPNPLIMSRILEKRDSISLFNPNPSVISRISEKRDSISVLNPNPSVISRISEKRESISVLNSNLSIMPRIPEKRDSIAVQNSNPSIMPRLPEKRDSIAVLNSNPSVISRVSNSIPTPISLLSTNVDYRLANDQLLRLNSPQLRRLNVSEKYINEAKKLYYNADCKIFTPRLPVTQVF